MSSEEVPETRKRVEAQLKRRRKEASSLSSESSDDESSWSMDRSLSELHIPESIRTDRHNAAREYLEKLTQGRAQEIEEKPAHPELVNESFLDLEGYLGEAGKKCIQQYHLWGDKFWQTDGPKRLNGLIKSYWSQVSAVTSMRKKLILQEYPPLTSPLTIAMVIDFNNRPGGATEDAVNVWRVEIGHFKSINRQITSNTGMTCVNFMDCDVPKRENQTKWQDWADMVSVAVGKRKASANDRGDVLDNFVRFLRKPSLDRWNVIIASNLLGVFRKDFSDAHFDLFKKLPYAGKFLEGEIQRLTKTMSNEPNVLIEGNFPSGYSVLIELMMDRDEIEFTRNWEAINFLLSPKGGLNIAGVMNILIRDGVKELQNVQVQNIVNDPVQLSKESESVVEDASVAKNDEQGAKKKRRKKKGSKKEEKCLTRVAYPLGNDFDSGAALSINSDQILTEFGNIAREFLRVRQKLADDILTDDTVQDIKLLQNVINKEDSVLSTFLDTICMLKSANLDIETEITNIAQKLQDFTLPGAQPMQTGEEGPVPISPPATRRGGLFDMSHSGEGDYVFGSGEGEDGEGKFVFASHVARSTRRKNRSQKQSKRRNTGGHRRRPKRRSSSSYSIVYV